MYGGKASVTSGVELIRHTGVVMAKASRCLGGRPNGRYYSVYGPVYNGDAAICSTAETRCTMAVSWTTC